MFSSAAALPLAAAAWPFRARFCLFSFFELIELDVLLLVFQELPLDGGAAHDEILFLLNPQSLLIDYADLKVQVCQPGA